MQKSSKHSSCCSNNDAQACPGQVVICSGAVNHISSADEASQVSMQLLSNGTSIVSVHAYEDGRITFSKAPYKEYNKPM
jgi:hypothetical protein